MWDWEKKSDVTTDSEETTKIRVTLKYIFYK